MEKIKIEKNEELGSVLLKLENSKEKDIVFSIAEGAIMLQSVINLKILKKRAEELGKSVAIERNREEASIISRQDIQSELYANKIDSGNVGIRTEKASPLNFDRKESDFAKKDKKMEVSNGVGRIKMFDIVKKREASVSNVPSKQVYEKKEEKKIVMEKKYPEIRNFTPQNSAKNQQERVGREAPKVGKKKIRIPSIMSKVFYVFIFVVIATAIVSAAMTLPKVKIDIKLMAWELPDNRELILDENATASDADKGIIPAKKEEANGEISESYPTTGKKRIVSKASGKVTIYNEYSSSDQKIVATTRFLSKDGHMFRIEENVTIPGFTRVEGKDVPGEVTVDVVADKAGEGFNIGPTSFTIPGYQGGMKYSTIYGRSGEAMAGGADREAMYFSESDYITAKEKLVKEVREKNDLEISGKNVDPYILLNGTRKEDGVKIITDAKVGDIADKFKMTVSIKESALFANKAHIDDIVDWKISSENNGNVEVVGGSRKYEIREVVKKENGPMVLPVNISQNVVAKIDIDKVKRDIYNKNEEEVREYFAGIKEFKSVNVTFSWTKSVPSSNDKIIINIEKQAGY